MKRRETTTAQMNREQRPTLFTSHIAMAPFTGLMLNIARESR
jgi:hypothetical protein